MLRWIKMNQYHRGCSKGLMKMVHYHHIFNIFTVIEILFSSLQRTMLEFFFFIELRYQPLLERNIIRSRWITTLDRYHRDAIFSFFFFFLSQQLNSMKNIHSLQLLSIIETNASIARENYLEKKYREKY